ncbi:MAG: sensor histidine kinase, partial [Sphingobacteriia bacterium]
MKKFFANQLLRVGLVYWFLLIYMIAALVWWYIALQDQNQQITQLKMAASPATQNEVLDARRRKNAQYIGEGATFLGLILLGAVYVFRATRRQIRFAQQQQNFMMAITHELKTPIAIAQLNLQTLEKRQLDPPVREKLIRQTLSEADRLNELCNNILFASQLEGNAYALDLQPTQPSTLLQHAVQDFQTRYPQKPIKAKLDPDLTILADNLLFQMLVNNLLENAFKYDRSTEALVLEWVAAPQGPQLVLTDRGPGIPLAEREYVFEPFYRSGSENTRKAKGTGLGLYLCRQIADQHQARLGLKDNP